MEVAAQPPRTLLFYIHVLQDRAGHLFVPQDVVARIAAVANAPIYGIYETFLGHGLVGGHVFSFEAQGAKAGEVALRILRGERPDDIPPVRYDPNVYMFDARQLARWSLDERRLPPGSVVRFREPSAWDRYKWYAVGGDRAARRADGADRGPARASRSPPPGPAGARRAAALRDPAGRAVGHVPGPARPRGGPGDRPRAPAGGGGAGPGPGDARRGRRRARRHHPHHAPLGARRDGLDPVRLRDRRLPLDCPSHAERRGAPLCAARGASGRRRDRPAASRRHGNPVTRGRPARRGRLGRGHAGSQRGDRRAGVVRPSWSRGCGSSARSSPTRSRGSRPSGRCGRARPGSAGWRTARRSWCGWRGPTAAARTSTRGGST